MSPVEVELVWPESRMPVYQTDGAAGFDLAAVRWSRAIGDPPEKIRDDGVFLPSGRFRVIHTGLKLAIPHGFEGQVRPRSSLAAKKGVTVINTPGTVDSDYRGEVLVVLVNHGPSPAYIFFGERVAQMVISPVFRATFVEVERLDATVRGSGGFGSTGR